MYLHVPIRAVTKTPAAALPLTLTYAQGRQGATNAVYNPSSKHDTSFLSQWFNLEIMYMLCIFHKLELELRLQAALDTQRAHTLP